MERTLHLISFRLGVVLKIVVQRVSSASVTVNDQLIARIPEGLLLLVGFADGDDESTLFNLAEKVINLRIFPDESGRLSDSVLDINASILVVPQFTLYADTSKGRRPNFSAALNPQQAHPLFERFVELLKQRLGTVEKGEFGASMQVALINNGPVTILLDSNS